jgi:antitoxin component YwqK of YwqJK toxin-antitoxin module
MSSRLFCRAFRLQAEKDDYYSEYAFSRPDFYGNRKISEDKLYQVQASSMQFSNGLRDGQWMIVNGYGAPREQHTFRNGSENGLQLIFEEEEGSFTYLEYIYHSVNDTVNGQVLTLQSDGFPQYRGYFNMGVPHGIFRSYFPGDTSRFFKQELRFDNGFMTGNYLEYRDSNNLALSVLLQKEDSMRHDAFDMVYDDWSYGSPSRYYKANFNGKYFIYRLFDDGERTTSNFKKGVYSYYYQSQTLFSKGVKEYDKPVGQWVFYREGRDRIYKRIDFRDSFLMQGADTLKTFGLVKAYYDDGRLMFTGYATDKTSAYSCESEADMPIEEDYYLEFYDTIGKPLLVNGTGMIRELQANGYVLKEGRVENFLKQGIWVYYTKFGLPEAIGAYKDGKKTGRWLSGDLGGLNLNDRICYMSDEEFRAWINTFGGNLDLEEEIYVDGELISRQRMRTIKR